ncbi:MaoC family dehydratase [Kitasatospora sp. GP82]|uniref:MaoC family dehydratase n=1 Tax=Kitasatospora sp. GP82 TaxID=3035089 RepID=UPI0024737FFC|nr:MaoC family dehydratase [Kitasatospora sp. GP82]MDH6130251.1 itaconyl-CoA hydratase [Kitasatospora sp. GP82]
MDTTLQGFRQIGENRHREVVGAGLGELPAGTVIEHRPKRTVTELDHAMTLALTGNPAPVHSDAEYCRTAGHGQPLVCGIVSLGIVIGMTVRATSGLTSANLALDNVRFTAPVFVGDTLSATTEILQSRRSASRPEHGIVTCRITGHNQRGESVVTAERTFFVPADAQPVRDATDY